MADVGAKKGTKKASKTQQSRRQKQRQKKMFLKIIEKPNGKHTFLTQDGSQDRPKMVPRPLQDDLQKLLFSSSFLSSILVRFWSQLGSILAPLWASKAAASDLPYGALLSLKRQKSTHGPPRCPKSRPRRTQDRPRVPKNPPR